MQLPFSDLFTNILGIQSLANQFGAKQAEPEQVVHYGDLTCDTFTQTLPSTFSAGAASVVYIRDNLAVVPEHWVGKGVGKFRIGVQGMKVSAD